MQAAGGARRALPQILIARRVDALRGTVVVVARSGCLALVFLALEGSSCLLYTDTINHAPDVKLTGDVETTFHSIPGPRYHATAHDPDQSAQSLTYEWRRQLGDCPKTRADAEMGEIVGSSTPDFQNDFDFASTFCVWVVVRDDHGAVDWDHLSTQVKHLPTTAAIQVVSPMEIAPDDHFPLMSAIQLSGAQSRDPESDGKLTFQWSLTMGAETINPDACPTAEDSELCFTGAKEGTYVATLTVHDSRGGVATAMKTIVIDPDRAPCIERTDPEFATPQPDPRFGPTRIVRDPTKGMDVNYFEVKAVSDDLDPYPPLLDSRPSYYTFTYTWWMDGEDPNNPSGRRPAGQGQVAHLGFRANDFRYGDTLFVRVQVNDRVQRDFRTCAQDKVDNCTLDKDVPPRPPGHECFQWVTWRVEFMPVSQM
jgi:hypothetical protein